MELYNEDYGSTNKKSKLPIVIGVCITILVILMILIIYLIIYLRSTVTKITLNQVDAGELEQILYKEESAEGTKLYIPIRKIAQYFEYEDYRGDYKYKSEDENKCYVKNEFETAMFIANSNKLIKTRGNSDYEYIDLDEKVIKKDGELYTTIDGIEKAFNVEISCDEAKKNIDIYTMDYLITFYTTNLGLEEYSDVFADKKAIFENMIVVRKNGQYGVVEASTGNLILEIKYDSVSYLSNTKDFLVASNGKYGIVSKDATIKVKIAYDDIKVMDNQNGLYLIKQNNLYGIIDTDGEVILEPEYQQIGIDIGDFVQNGIESGYVLLDELIPIKNNNLWGFFNIKGEKITDFLYTEIGCKKSKVLSSYPVLAIPSCKMIVVGKNGLYNLIEIDGTEFVDNAFVFDSIYMKTDTSTGQNTFYMTFNGETINIEEYLSSKRNPT